MVSDDPTLGIGMVGYAFMGAVHSHAWRSAGRFFDLPLRPEMRVLCGRDESAATAAADRFGWAEVETDHRELIARDDIDVIDICTPGSSHAEIAIAALEAGKHVLCEKPLANSVEEAEAMAAAAASARDRGVRSMVAFNYRRVPALALARQLVADGRIGQVHHIRAVYLQDWLVDPEAPLVWRLQREMAGSGALGDLGAHIIDAAEFITGERLTGVTGLLETFVTERPIAGSSAGLAATAGSGTGEVTVDDAATFVGRLSGGGLATFEATRFATGRKNGMALEINGSEGSLSFAFEDMNVLWFFDNREDTTTAGFRRILVTEDSHPYVAAWWPPGHVLGYEHTFTHEVVDLVNDIANAADPSPSFDDGVHVQRVLDAVERSAGSNGGWVPIQT